MTAKYNLHMEALSDLEVAEHIDQGLASLNTRLSDRDEIRDTYLNLSGVDVGELAQAIQTACDAWDQVADLLPGFRA